MTEGKTVEAAAAHGRNERGARTRGKPGRSRRRQSGRDTGGRGEDAFAVVWDAEVVPLLERDHEGILEATTIIGELRRMTAMLH